MKIVLKIFKITAFVTAAIIVALIVLSYIFQGAVTKLFVNELNKGLTTDISIGRARFSLLKSFPRATIEFKEIVIASPPGTGLAPDSVKINNNLLEAGSLSASFKISKLLRKKYSVEKIVLEESTLLIETYGPGSSNLIVWKQGNRSDTSRLNLDLRNIIVNNSSLVYWSAKSDFLIKGKIHNASGKIRLTGSNTEINVKTKTDIEVIASGDKKILSDISDIDLNGLLLINPDSLSIGDCMIRYNKDEIEVNGPIYTKRKSLNLQLKSEHLNISTISNLSPTVVSEFLGINVKTAELSTDLHISGKYKPENKLELKGDVRVNNLRTLPQEKLSEISIGQLNSSIKLATSKSGLISNINIKDFAATYAGSNYKGSGSIRDLNKPFVDFNISGNVDLDKLSKHHNIQGLSDISGRVFSSIHLAGKTPGSSSIKIDDILKLKRSINLNLQDVSIITDKQNLELDKISGNIMIADNIWIDELSLLLAGQNIVVNGKIKGTQKLIEKQEGELELTAGLWADRLDLDALKPIFAKEKSDSASDKKKITDRFTAHITFNVDSLFMGKFQATQLDGSINYKNKLLNISSMNMLALEGSLSGNAGITISSRKQYLARGWFELDNININKAFTAFNNFGQQSIIAENIHGYLSGSLSVSTDIGPDFKLIMSSLNTTGNYLIRDGALINFEPAMKLSRFVEVDELEEIRFEELKNDLVIKDSRLMIPAMDINSSAFNISVSGEQSFKGDFEYHLKILLSDILGKKARGSESYISEFGTIEDDGLGRTTLLLKLIGGQGGTEVSYDMQQLSQNIKEDLNEEKTRLKTILNDEYGWYKSDSLNTGSEAKSKKFRITWEETGNVEQAEDEKNQKGIKLFQKLKKRNGKQVRKDTIIKKF